MTLHSKLLSSRNLPDSTAQFNILGNGDGITCTHVHICTALCHARRQ